MKVDFQKYLQDSRIPDPTCCSTETESIVKMVKISVDLWSEEDLKDKFDVQERRLG